MKLEEFPNNKISELLSWIQNEEEKQFWSGNTFQNGLNPKKFAIHLLRKDITSLCFLGPQKSLIAYGEIVFPCLKKGVLCRVIIKPDSRKKGIGKTFISQLLNWAFQEKSLHTVTLNTFGHNYPARKCYQSLGFKEVALKENFRRVENQWRDLVIMEKMHPSIKIQSIQ
ncbi:GNAT family N-acetyltransferase [Opitutales bacterium]|nr:GNAT family N-acetyltransferase [Opitutales bacterium]